MKTATILVSLSTEFFYTLLLFVTWIVLLGWAAALISACTLIFRNRDSDEENETTPEAIPVAVSTRHDHSPAPLGLRR
jgi:hypothetical protein